MRMAWSWSKLRRVDPLPVEKRAQYSISDPVLAAMLGYTSASGVTVSEDSAMTLSAVYRAASIVANSVASLPLRTLQPTGSGEQKERTSSFLDKPNGPDRLTAFEWKQLIVVHLLLHGNAFLQHVYNGAGALVALQPIHPCSVDVEWDNSYAGGKKFTVSEGSKKIPFGGDGMTQLMGLSLDGLRGLGVVTLARLSFGTSLQGDKAAFRTFSNGAMISGLVTPAVDEDLDETEAKTVKMTINRTMSGPENAGDIAVFNKRLQFQSWQLSNADAQFLESRTFGIDEVGRWFGVPPHLLGLTEKSTSWGQGIAEQNRGLSRYTLSSWTDPIQERLSRLIPQPKFAEFDYSAFVKPSPEDEIKLLIDQVNSGLLTLNEARAIRNMGALPGGDLPRLPAGSIPPAQALAAATGEEDAG